LLPLLFLLILQKNIILFFSRFGIEIINSRLPPAFSKKHNIHNKNSLHLSHTRLRQMRIFWEKQGRRSLQRGKGGRGLEYSGLPVRIRNVDEGRGRIIWVGAV